MWAAICLVAMIKLLALYWGCFKAQTPLAITQVICQRLVINVSLIERTGGAKSERKTAILIERDKDKHREWLHFYLLIHHPIRGALTGPNLLCSNSLSGCCIYEVPSKQWHLSRHSDHTLSSLLSSCPRLCVQVCVCVFVSLLKGPLTRASAGVRKAQGWVSTARQLMLLKVQPNPEVYTHVSLCLSDLQSVHLAHCLSVPLSQSYLASCYTEMPAGCAEVSDCNNCES